VTLTFILTNHGFDLPAPALAYDADGNLLSGSQYLAHLYVGLDKNTLQSLSPVAPFLEGSLAGYLQETYIEDFSANYFKNTSYFVQIRAWDASLGSTWQIAASKGLGGVGESSIGQETTGGSGGVPSLPRGLSGLQSFRLSPLTVPEPSTYALFGFGAALLWCGSRRLR
jgi:PEP-CTERM motif